MGFGHEWTDRLKIHNRKYFPETRCRGYLRSRIIWSPTLLWVVTMPHGVVPRTRTFRNGSSISWWMSHISWGWPGKENETSTQQEKKRRKEKPEENLLKDPAGRLTSFFLTVQYCLLVLRFCLGFEGWVVMTVLVKNPKRLFQDAPSQFAYLGVTMKSCTDGLPRRTGLCVLFHALQFLIICVGPGTEWWSPRWVHRIWLKNSISGRCWCFGIWCQRKGRSTRRNGSMGRGLSTMARVDFNVVSRSCCWCSISIRVVRVESIGSSFWGNWKRTRSGFFLDRWHGRCRRSGQFLFLLGLRVDCRGDPLLGANRDWDCGPRFSSTRDRNRWVSRSWVRIRHVSGVVNANKVGGRMFPFHKRWRMQGGGTKVRVRIFHHAWRNAPVSHQCGWHWRWG